MSILSETRSKLSTRNSSELTAVEDQPALREMWDKMQELRAEMNQAKKDAANEAAKPYLEVMEKLEKQYAFLLKLSA